MPVEHTAGEPTANGRRAAAISNAINRPHHEHYGRGGTTTRTIIQPNYVVCFLEDIYTPGERTLLENGQHEAVRHARQIFQDAMRERFVAAVEEIDPDIAAEVFVLEPQGADRAPEEPVSA